LDTEILPTVVHLHWSRNPKLVRETTRGITLCGKKVVHAELTAFDADVTCAQCRVRAGLTKTFGKNINGWIGREIAVTPQEKYKGSSDEPTLDEADARYLQV
jgi:hypothetical protein